MKKVIVITGPTASGKTALSLEIAKTYKKEIINGDSVQIYKELNVGSAKVTEDEKQGIFHHLLDKVTLLETYSIYNFQKDVRELIEKLDVPVIVGGSGLYIKSALYDYELEENHLGTAKELSHLNIEDTYKKLKELDPKIIVDKNNPQRVLRAYNDAVSGKLRSEKKGENKPLYDILIIYLDIPRDILKTRVQKRLDIMLENGFIAEVIKLKEKYLLDDLNIIGYREINEYLKGIITLDEAKTLIVTKTMQFAKRQKTWFKNQMNPIVLEALDKDLITKANALVNDFLKESK